MLTAVWVELALVLDKDVREHSVNMSAHPLSLVGRAEDANDGHLSQQLLAVGRTAIVVRRRLVRRNRVDHRQPKSDEPIRVRLCRRREISLRDRTSARGHLWGRSEFVSPRCFERNEETAPLPQSIDEPTL